MLKVGTIKALWRYPVKGMAGESMSTADISEDGLLGDRIWALRDANRQEIQSCKYRPELLRCIARFRNPVPRGGCQQVDITLPDGTVMGAEDNAIHPILSHLTGHPSTLALRRSAEDLDFYRRYKSDAHGWRNELKATFERLPAEPLPDLDNLPQTAQDFVTLPGTFFLVAPLHVMTTASLDFLKRQAPNADWSIARFRPNLVIQTEPQFQGLVEQAWIGGQIHINNVIIQCNGTTPRCGVVSKPQQGLATDLQVLRTVVARADQNVGIYATTSQQGVISVGDAVFVALPDEGIKCNS